MHRTDSYFTN